MTSPNDAAAPVYDLAYNDYINDSITQKEVAFITTNIPKGTVLDIGCGTGRHLIPLVQQGYAVTGIDNSAGMLAVLKQKMPSAHIIHDSVFIHQFHTQFNGALCMWNPLAEIALDEVHLESLFKKIADLLLPGGVFIFDLWEVDEADLKLYTNTIEKDGLRYETEFSHTNFEKKTRISDAHERITIKKGDEVVQVIESKFQQRWWRKEELLRALAKAGFKKIQVFNEHFTPFTGTDSKMVFVAKK
jgi:SAM-dependent methyltransferase